MTFEDSLRPGSSVALIATCCLLLAQFIALTNGMDIEDKSYGVIVDCGSSGTRTNIFVWDSTLGFPDLLHNIEPLRNEFGSPVSSKIFPGLSAMSEEPEKVEPYLKNIVSFISKQIPKNWHSSTSIYIMATAGMRLLHPSKQQAIVDKVAEHMNNSKEFARARTSIISGTKEGIYQWITVNSKSKRFDEKSFDDENRKTFGIIEMGGASLQVTYQISDALDFDTFNKLKEIDIYAANSFAGLIVQPAVARVSKEYNYSLFSASFLGFGSKSARQAYVDLLVSEWMDGLKDGDAAPKHTGTFKQSIGKFKSFSQHATDYKQNLSYELYFDDPCLPPGSTEELEKPYEMLKPDRKYTIGYTADNELSYKKFYVHLKGTGNYDSCKEFLKLLLKRAKEEGMNCNDYEPCPMKLLETPFVAFDRYQFYGLADFYYTTKQLYQPGVYNSEAFVGTSEDICKKPLGEFSSGDVNYTRAQQACFKAAWIDTFLVDGLLMPKEYRNFRTIGEINGDTLDWTLGAAIDKAASIDAASQRIHRDDN